VVVVFVVPDCRSSSKISVAQSVINQDNSSLSSMDTDQLLDLCLLDKRGAQGSATKDRCSTATDSTAGRSRDGNNHKVTESVSVKAVLENLEELWDTKLYMDEYDMDSCMQGLKRQT